MRMPNGPGCVSVCERQQLQRAESAYSSIPSALRDTWRKTYLRYSFEHHLSTAAVDARMSSLSRRPPSGSRRISLRTVLPSAIMRISAAEPPPCRFTRIRAHRCSISEGNRRALRFLRRRITDFVRVISACHGLDCSSGCTNTMVRAPWLGRPSIRRISNLLLATRTKVSRATRNKNNHLLKILHSDRHRSSSLVRERNIPAACARSLPADPPSL